MKTYNFILFALLLGLGSCNPRGNNETTDRGNEAADTLHYKPSVSATSSPEFNLKQVPVSTKLAGDFPYLSAPEGYKYSEETNKKLEEKYFFYSDSLVRKVSGQYFHTAVFSSGDGFDDTFVVREFKNAVEKLGGVEIYSGGLPTAANQLIEKENPVYVSDMYDPRPYKYKQFLIRTPKENIWIELCHGLNANQIDLTVVKEEMADEKGN